MEELFKIVRRTDYADFICLRCGAGDEEITVTYLGRDPSMPKFRFHCARCDDTQDLKGHGHWEGFPMEPVPPRKYE